MNYDELDHMGMDNPVDKKPVRLSIGIFLLFIFMAIFSRDDLSISILVKLFLIVMGIFLLWEEFYSSFIHRPIRVVVKHDGLVLFFRWSKPKKVAWDEIELVLISEIYDGGSLVVKGVKRAYFFETIICEEIRRHYYSAKGRSAPDLREYWEAQPSGWNKFWRQPLKYRHSKP